MRALSGLFPATALLPLFIPVLLGCSGSGADQAPQSSRVLNVAGAILHQEGRIDGYESELVPISPYSPASGALAIGPDGVLAVRQSQASQVLLFDRSGKQVGSVGRGGEGPGEFRATSRVGWLGSTLWVSDSRAARLTTFPDLGTGEVATKMYPVRGLPPRGSRPRFVYSSPVGLRGRDTLMMAFQVAAGDPSPLYGDRITYGLLPLATGDTVIEVAQVELGERQVDLPGGGVTVLPFPELSFARYTSSIDLLTTAVVRDDRSDSVAVRIRQVQTRGGTQSEFDAVIPVHEIPNSVRDSVANSFVERMGVSPSIPDIYPPLKDFLQGPLGEVWLEYANAQDEGRSYAVFTRSGQPTGSLTLPPGMRVGAVDVDGVWVLEKDEFDVEHLTRFRVEWKN